MAVSIDRVYQKVLAFANKEQRGYITPQEFNLFADQAQMEIFEQYFYDINQWTRQQGNSHEYSDMLTNLEEKIDIFASVATGDNVTVLNKWGDINLNDGDKEIYKLGSIRVKYPENSSYVTAEQLKSRKEFVLYSRSPLTKHTRKRPIFHRYTTAYGDDRIKIYPYPVEDDGSNFDLSTIEFVNDYIQVKSIDHPGAYNVTGHYFYFDQQEMIDMLGEVFTHHDTINISTTNSTGDVNKISNHLAILWTTDSANSVDGHAHGRLHSLQHPHHVGTTVDFAIGDRIFLSTPKVLSNNRNVQVDYIRKPKTPNWGYVVVNDKALYNSTNSTDFQLHASEESELVYRILAFAGIAIEKPQLAQAAMGLEGAKVQQEKQ